MNKKKNKSKPKNNSLALKLEKAKNMWAGAIDLMEGSESEQHMKKRSSILTVAKALRISPFGVNILGGLPYVNNLGRKQYLARVESSAEFEYNWVKRSENDQDKAICEARLVIGGKPITPWVVGECSPASMKMGTLAGHQNHMAQTRAENRCIQNKYGLIMHMELIERIAEMSRSGEVTKQQALEAANAGNVSAEEMNVEDREIIQKPKESETSGEYHKTKLDAYLTKKGVKSDKDKLKFIKRVTSLVVKDYKKMPPRVAQEILAQLLMRK